MDTKRGEPSLTGAQNTKGKITSSSAMAERPRKLDQLFQVGGQFEAKLLINSLLRQLAADTTHTTNTTTHKIYRNTKLKTG